MRNYKKQKDFFEQKIQKKNQKLVVYILYKTRAKFSNFRQLSEAEKQQDSKNRGKMKLSIRNQEEEASQGIEVKEDREKVQ